MGGREDNNQVLLDGLAGAVQQGTRQARSRLGWVDDAGDVTASFRLPASRIATIDSPRFALSATLGLDSDALAPSTAPPGTLLGRHRHDLIGRRASALAPFADDLIYTVPIPRRPRNPDVCDCSRDRHIDRSLGTYICA